MKEKCIVCQRRKPDYRKKNLTCSKKCAMAWHHLPILKREELRGERYNRK